MRLIDADKLVKAIENENPGLSISGAIEKFARIAQVNMQPTVEAIPIEWLKRYEFAKGQEVRLQDAINEWEKENENR